MTLAEILCIAVVGLGVGGPNGTPENSLACQQMDTVIQYAHESNIRPEIMLSLIHHESRWQPRAVSRAGACGLTQVLPRYTGRSAPGVPTLTCNDLFDPVTSIMAGTRTLKHWLRNYGRGNMRIALCGYNAGYRCKGDNAHRGGLNYAYRVLRTSRRISAEAERIRDRSERQ